MFHAGASAFRRYVPDGYEHVYPCPLCGDEFPIERLSDLSRDHVPAKGLGGRTVIVLTCKACNNTAGGTLQSHMISREAEILFRMGRMTMRRRGVAMIATVCIDVEYIHHEGGIEVHVRDTARNRFIVPDGGVSLGNELGQGERVSLVPRDGYVSHLARVSLLRDGYLAAFAAFGYGYAYSESLRRVHEQLDDPVKEIIPRFITVDLAATGGERQILLSHGEPASGCLYVRIGRYVVLLPWLDGDPYDRIAADDHVGGKLQLSEVVPWPRRPMYAIDHDSVPGVVAARREGLD